MVVWKELQKHIKEEEQLLNLPTPMLKRKHTIELWILYC